VLCNHAHFDHYDGVYSILQRDRPQLWTLDRVAILVANPSLLRAPFLDPPPVKFDRLAKDGETLTWREYQLRLRSLPGQTEFTMGVETEIDGKKCFFTADNSFPQGQFSGSGGWSAGRSSSCMAHAARWTTVRMLFWRWMSNREEDPKWNAADADAADSRGSNKF
jgi:glyoxylase-like metal-dependent hydrolase (beta-lactamase superfamily II)